MDIIVKTEAMLNLIIEQDLKIQSGITTVPKGTEIHTMEDKELSDVKVMDVDKNHSHSIVLGGLLDISKTTLLIPFTELIISEEIRSKTS